MTDKPNPPSESMPLTPEGYRRRKFMIVCRALFYGTLVAIPLKLSRCGENETVEEEKEMVSDLEKRLSTAKDAQGNLVYAKDPMTENYLRRDSDIGKLIEKFSENERQLIVVKDCEGNPMVDVENQSVRLARVVAERLTGADKILFSNSKRHISIRSSFRTNFEQSYNDENFTGLNEQGQLAKKKIGESFHEIGFAVDVVNWVDAQHSLIQIGFIGGMYTDDETMVRHIQRDGKFKEEKTKARNVYPNHFSIGEGQKMNLFKKKKINPDAGFWESIKNAWETAGEKARALVTLNTRLVEFCCYNESLERHTISYIDQSKAIRKFMKEFRGFCKEIYGR